ncbi:MAG: hypothetical protein LUF92_10095 [Clostridiales bacterium]|nr:hypothetical protein [Clostridiales bacterium]
MSSAKKPEPDHREIFPDICVCCGIPVSEGRLICWSCEHSNDPDEMDYFCHKKEATPGLAVAAEKERRYTKGIRIPFFSKKNG